MELILGLDIGTTSFKAILYSSEQGRIIRASTRPTPTDHPQPGFSEHDPQLIWQTAVDCIRECCAGAAPTALAISSMAEAGVLVDAQGQALSPVIAWYDRRSEPQASWIEQQISVNRLYRITGQRASPSFGVTKLLWLREHQPEAFSHAARWLPVPAYLLYRLCGEMFVDYTIAARTLLFDQRTLDWSGELCEAFGLRSALFPKAVPGGTLVGTLTQSTANDTGLPVTTRCVVGGHDHLCATLAAGAYTPGAVTDSTGSANALLLLLPNFLDDPRQGARGYACGAYVIPGLYALKGGLKAAGSAIEWLAKQLSPGANGPDYSALENAAAKGVGRRAGPLWLPHLIGSGTPEGDRFSRAGLVGARFEDGSGDLFRAMLESMAFWLRHNLEEMQAFTNIPLQSLTLTGGVTRLRLLSQLKADVLGREVLVCQVPEAAAAGAALLAGLGAGVFTNPEEASRSLHYPATSIAPDPARAQWYEAMYQQVYRQLYETLQPLNETLQRLEQ